MSSLSTENNNWAFVLTGCIRKPFCLAGLICMRNQGSWETPTYVLERSMKTSDEKNIPYVRFLQGHFQKRRKTSRILNKSDIAWRALFLKKQNTTKKPTKQELKLRNMTQQVLCHSRLATEQKKPTTKRSLTKWSNQGPQQLRYLFSTALQS